LRAADLLAESGRERSARFRRCLRRAAGQPASDEAVHDLRVAIRRVLAWIAVREALAGPDRRLRETRLSLGALMSPLGKLRDAHVKRDWIRKLVPEGDEPSYLYAIQVANEILRWEARVRERLGEKSTGRLRVPLPEGKTSAGGRTAAAPPAAKFLGGLAREVSRHRKAALDPARPEPLHRMRLAFKRYRYAAEVLLPLFPKATEETANRLHAFQTLLGTIHDLDVILAEAAAFRGKILGIPAESDLEAACGRLRKEKFLEFREAAGAPGSLATVLGSEFRP